MQGTKSHWQALGLGLGLGLANWPPSLSIVDDRCMGNRIADGRAGHECSRGDDVALKRLLSRESPASLDATATSSYPGLPRGELSQLSSTLACIPAANKQQQGTG
jgi:hypothetical protein